MSRLQPLGALDASTYQAHALHGEARPWVEKNCYIDVWIELLHTLGLDPMAMLAFTLAIDFEGDQWTFYKPPHSELRALYGIDVQELNVWRPLIDHASEHLAAGKLISTEIDAFWLPDTAATDYRQHHVKTTIVLADLDLANERLGYFHNAGYFELAGDDFRQLFQLKGPPAEGHLPLFAETIRIDRLQRRDPDELAALARGFLREHLVMRPTTNPLRRFEQRFERELPTLVTQGLGHYHAWAFATIRQLGSAFDLAAEHLRWQAHLADVASLCEAATAFDVIAQTTKTLILKVARAVNTQRPGDFKPLFDEMARAWDEGFDALNRA